MERYLANDTPTDGDDFIVLMAALQPVALSFAYGFNPSFNKMTLTGLSDVEAITEGLALLGTDYPFRQGIVFELERR